VGQFVWDSPLTRLVIGFQISIHWKGREPPFCSRAESYAEYNLIGKRLEQSVDKFHLTEQNPFDSSPRKNSDMSRYRKVVCVFELVQRMPPFLSAKPYLCKFIPVRFLFQLSP